MFPVWILLYLITSQCNAYNMESYCNKEISMTSQADLELDDEHIYDRRWFFSNRKKSECETKVRAWYSPYNKIMFYFENLDLRCDEGHLEFHVGQSGYMRVPGLERNLCGESKPTQVFTVNDRYMRIKYVSKKPQSKHDVFSIIMTSYSDGTCHRYSYKCDNSRCIDRNIVCNDYDSCGDGSGCTQQKTSIIIGASVGSLVVAGIIVTVVVRFVCCKRKQRETSSNLQQTPNTMRVAYTAPVNECFSQLTYGDNYGRSYPTNPVQYQGTYTGFTPTRIGDAQGCDEEYYEPIQDLPPPYSEVAETDRRRNELKEVNNTDSEISNNQEQVYADFEN